MAHASDEPPAYVFWPYTPTIAAGAICAVVMALLFVGHTFCLVKARTYFCLPLVIGALCEAIGYVARAAAHGNMLDEVPYIIQSTLLLLAPILFAASLYMLLTRVMQRTHSTELSIVRALWIPRIFVSGDILCFFVQAGGAGILISSSADGDGMQRGERVILAGLVLQVLLLAFFVVVAAIWHGRLRARVAGGGEEVAWARCAWCVWGLYAASLCVSVRNVCRVVEYAMGQDGYLLSHEFPIYIYDFLPMMATLIISLACYDPSIKIGTKAGHSQIDLELADR